jgi:alpha-glucosidase
MGLGMGLSGMFNVGHDIGGFAGPMPDAELLTRWMQACALNPRCIMNSWKEDGSVNTPWLHAAATAHIRAAIELRLTLLPYLYSCLHDAVAHHRPVLRPTFLEFADDTRCWDDNDEFMVGSELLVAPVLDADGTTRRVYLPRSSDTPGWRCFHTGAWFDAGVEVEVDAPIERLPLFVRSNATLPTTDTADFTRRTDEPSRALRLYPAPAPVAAPARRSLTWIEDDGVTRDGASTRIGVTLGASDHVSVDVRVEGEFALPFAEVRLVLPPDESRRIQSTSPDLPLR